MTKLLFVDYGFELYRSGFLEALQLRGFQIHCITQKRTMISNPEINFKQIGNVNYESKLRALQELIRIPLVIYSIKKIDPKVIVVGNMGVNSLASVIYSKFFQVPVIVWARLSLWTEKDRNLLTRLWRKLILFMCYSVIVNSKSGDSYIRSLGKTEISIIPQVSNIQRISDRYLGNSGSSIGNRVYCYVGRLIKGKGLDRVLELLALTKFQGKIRIVGDGPLLDKLLNIRTPDQMKIEFLGWLDSNQIEEVISKSDALIFPSECDEWGLAVVEAINLGCPVLGSIRAGAVEELLKHRDHGFLFDPNQSHTIVEAFSEFAKLGDKDLEQLRINCLNLSVDRKLSVESMADLFQDAILRAVK